MGKVYDSMTTEKRVEHLRQCWGVRPGFGGWLAQAKVWLQQTEGALPYDRVSQADIVSAYSAAARLHLMIDGEHCMVMIRGKSRPKIKCEIGALGVVQLAAESGIVLNARTIKAGDEIELDEGAGTVRHVPAWTRGQAAGETLGYYAIARYADGRQIVRGMSVDETLKRATNSDAWKSWQDPMGEKTLILQMRKVVPFDSYIESALTTAEVGDTWALSETDEGDPPPQTAPKATKERVMDAAARARQQATDEAFVAGDEPEQFADDELPI